MGINQVAQQCARLRSGHRALAVWETAGLSHQRATPTSRPASLGPSLLRTCRAHSSDGVWPLTGSVAGAPQVGRSPPRPPFLRDRGKPWMNRNLEPPDCSREFLVQIIPDRFPYMSREILPESLRGIYAGIFPAHWGATLRSVRYHPFTEPLNNCTRSAIFLDFIKQI